MECKESHYIFYEGIYSNANNYVQIGEVKSNTTFLSTEVQQASILGPLQFIIYTNNIAKSINLLHTIIYADEMTFMGNISTFQLRNDQTLDENIIFLLIFLTK